MGRATKFPASRLRSCLGLVRSHWQSAVDIGAWLHNGADDMASGDRSVRLISQENVS
ncbi:hypothetical protein L861_10045 [Litchfieldella anticariensis FP35 = DSM 16096]|uniref:Uncharacterized protein n=1 Tax=Litchfieldella anticariensis (strain DSM 16096 / CECT 5854 / CIP 108499 / LMG 22089 / FP35) TaxID=1121939 RepID=S2LD04_LITA3|nr:hypothetical protein [Halomonas anticariensis]EPC02676.1 hypothetical protein L861_10045 [Halomonas anticariensis FP35 = DSM 16096]